jgi:hypothetical protein
MSVKTAAKAARFDATNSANAARLANTKAKILGEVFIYYFKSASCKKKKRTLLCASDYRLNTPR